MNRSRTPFKFMMRWAVMSIGFALCLGSTAKTSSVVTYAERERPTHIGTFEGSTTFTTSSSNGINPGLFIEVMDDEGNLTQYESEDGVITIPNTQEGAYITQAKLLGKTKYVDKDTGEVLEAWEEGRNLSLVSVENPVLATTGKNLFDLSDDDKLCVYAGGNIVTEDHTRIYQITESTINVVNQGTFANHLGYKLPVKNIDSLVISGEGFGATFFYRYFGENFTPLTGEGQRTKRYLIDDFGKKYVILNRSEFPPEAEYIFLGLGDHSLSNYTMKDIQIEENSQATTYKPYQSSTLTVNEQLTLRGIGSVRDELDLMTGEMMRRIGEYLLDGNDNENWTLNTTYDINDTYVKFILRNVPSDMALKNSLSHWLTNCFKNQLRVIGVPNEEGISSEGNMHAPLMITIKRDKLTESTPKGFKLWLSQSPVTIQYTLLTSDKRSVRLASNYYFQPTPNQSIQVNGEITPTVASLTIPTDSLSFTIDPNQAAGQQFMAPNFTLTNETFAPLRLQLKAFEQVTDVLNDVLPATHSDWDQLNTQQSKDIALALVPKPSDQWLSLIEGPRYAANTSNDFIGTIKGQSTVEFGFEALHGRAFSEVLAPRYQFTFIFEVN